MTDEPGQAERALYLAAVRGGGRLCPADLTPADRPALAALVARGLLSPTPTGWTAANPRACGDRLGGELRARALRLLLHAERLPGTLAPLAHAYDAARHAPADSPPVAFPAVDFPAVGRGAVEPGPGSVDEAADARRRISELVSECREEVLAAQPAPRPLEALRMALAQDLSLLRRGCSLRTVYQPATVADPAALSQLALRTGRGAQIRVLAEPYERVLVFDRTVAVIPADADRNRATFLTDPTTVAYLVAQFERDWARATPADRHLDPPPPTTVRIGRLLARGLTQRAVATRLGLSERTVAGHISRLRERYGAQTLFHLGWQMREEQS
ncbi:helix-turn-helix domain-containing protein [Kitasatospora brasiliensis]|uniref:helix-turn-helix domain-containing protein n=1 Tax=Kitasatospora brasiliensis TaxID=3058040 RepID=UPI00293108A9|nr:helix-turn-helix domain-containing protein [Kitasatospora sp. K002]